MPYLFAHFREKLTPDGEQVHFAVSKNGYEWQSVNSGKPIFFCTEGELGCRDIEIARLKTGGFVIIATNLCIVRHMDKNGKVDWQQIASSSSKCISLWRSEDLVSFSKQELVCLNRDDFGCIWAPEIFYDDENGDYIVHFGATVSADDYSHMAIYYCKTDDFRSFSQPKLFFDRPCGVFDSHLVKVKDKYHLFYKTSAEPLMNMHESSTELFGKWEHDDELQDYMRSLTRPGSYEAATTYILPDGKWCLMLDFFGCEKDKMGYVPFVSDEPGNGAFVMDKADFKFPYGFKHGGVLEITNDEYERIIKAYNSDSLQPEL